MTRSVVLGALVVVAGLAAGCADDTGPEASNTESMPRSMEVLPPSTDEAVAPSADESAVLAVAESALIAISEEDMVAFTDLMFEEGIIVPTNEENVTILSRAERRARNPEVDIVERGFDPQVQVSGRVASVWLPYDLYIDGEWSHCGVDIFTMAKDGDQWRILSAAWSALQPPECDPHPDGAPA